MVWQPGQSGNPLGRAVEKPFADALRMELALIEKGEQTTAPLGSLRWNVRQLLEKGEVPAIKEVADRLDGKVPQQLQHANEKGDGPAQFLFQTVYEQPHDK